MFYKAQIPYVRSKELLGHGAWVPVSTDGSKVCLGFGEEPKSSDSLCLGHSKCGEEPGKGSRVFCLGSCTEVWTWGDVRVDRVVMHPESE